jgi:hypothetical protein
VDTGSCKETRQNKISRISDQAGPAVEASAAPPQAFAVALLCLA